MQPNRSNVLRVTATVTCLDCRERYDKGNLSIIYRITGLVYDEEGKANEAWYERREAFLEAHTGHNVLLEVDSR